MTERRGARGRSTIIKRPDGRWHGFVSMGTNGDGVRDRRHVSARTRAEVVVKVRELESKRDAGSVNAARKPMKVEEWLTYWVDTIAPPDVEQLGRPANPYCPPTTHDQSGNPRSPSQPVHKFRLSAAVPGLQAGSSPLDPPAQS